MEELSLWAGRVIVVFLGLVGAGIIVLMIAGAQRRPWGINLSRLIAEENGDASFSRFQFLIFTFVIAMCVLVLTLEGGRFPDISPQVLALLGISSGSYVVAKGIELSSGDDSGNKAGGGVPPVG